MISQPGQDQKQFDQMYAVQSMAIVATKSSGTLKESPWRPMEMICDGDGDGRVFPVEVDWNFPRHPGDGADSANRELLIYKEFQSDKETVIVTRAKALKNLAVALAILTITTAFLCEWLIRWRFRTNQEVEA